MDQFPQGENQTGEYYEGNNSFEGLSDNQFQEKSIFSGDNSWNHFNGMNQKSPKKKTFGKGLGLGIVVGIGLSFAVLIGGTGIYHMMTGNYITFGGRRAVETIHGSRVIDQNVANKLTEITSYIDLYYTGEYDDATLQDGLLHGLVSSLGDKYSEYYNPKEFKELQESNTGSYAGIGAGLIQDEETKRVILTKIYKDTPAAEVGLAENDQVLKVDGYDVTKGDLTAAVDHMRGDENTTVTLTVYRDSTGETKDYTLTRRIITLPSVEYEMLANKIGYIHIEQFQTDTANQFNTALADLQKQGMEKMIIDLRDNPGGMLDVVVNILDTILPKGLIVYTQDKQGNRQDFTSDDNCLNYPMVVLINGNSASASEIFAGAIKDYKYGTLIGTKTYGKGIVQSIFQLSDNDGLKITSANYYTPNGNFIHGKGIEPDVELEYKFLGEEGAKYDKTLDNQLIYAQEYLMKGTE